MAYYIHLCIRYNVHIENDNYTNNILKTDTTEVYAKSGVDVSANEGQ